MRDKKLWIFNCADTFSGNPKWLFLYIALHRSDIRPVWVSESEECVRLVRRLGFRAVVLSSPAGRRLQQRAGVFVVNQVKERIPPEMAGITLLNLWHGVGVKAIERRLTEGDLLPRIAAKYIRNNRVYHETQQFLVTSPFMESHFVDQIGLREDQLVRGGYPQNIYTRRFGRFASFDHDIRRRMGLPGSTRLAVYAPTYRTHHSGEDFLRAALPDVNALVQTLEDTDTLLILKMHPRMQEDAAFRDLKAQHGDNSRLLFWDNADDIYEVFDRVDLAVVDYSSILYDMLAAGVQKVIRYAFDMHAPGVLEHSHDYLALSAGTLALDFPALLDALRGHNRIDDSDRARLMDHFWAYDIDETFERLIDAGLTHEPRPVELPVLHTFDVFDTLLGRTTTVPEGVFFMVRDRILAHPGDFTSDLARDFVRVRQQAERAERDSRRKDPRLDVSKQFEISLDAIYRRIGETLGLSTIQRESLLGWELEAEKSVSIPIPDQIERVRRLVDRGDTVALISDMYLPEGFVRELLRTADPLLADLPLFLSSSFGVQKSTGKLFLEAYKALDYDFAEWRHFGDNPRADGDEPRKLGINARLLPPTRFAPYEHAVAKSLDSGDGYAIASMLRSRRLPAGETSAANFAYSYVATYLVPYVLWTLQDAQRRGYRTLYFLSRDGFHLKRIADAAIAELGLDLKTRYIYGSRAAWRLAAQTDDVDDEVFGPFGSFAGAQGVRDVAVILDTTPATLIAEVPELARFARETVLTAAEREGLLRVLRNSTVVRRRILAKAESDRHAVAGYLTQEIDFDEPWAVVEYWGRGYTQDCFQRIIDAVGLGAAHPAPFYYARSIYGSAARAIRHNYTAGAFSMLFVEAIFANLDHGTVEGYRHESSRWEPVMRARQNDVELHDALTLELPRATRDLLALPLTDRDRSLRRLFTFGFDYFGAHPTDAVFIERLAPLQDAVVLGEAEREFAPALTIPLFLRYLDRRRRMGITSNWPITSARTVGLVRWLVLAQKRVGFRRVIRRHMRRATSRTSTSTPRWLFDDELLAAGLSSEHISPTTGVAP